GAKRLELGRKQMEYTMADPHLACCLPCRARQRQLRLQRLLEAVSERQQRALRRNRALRQEFLQLGAHMGTRGWHSIREMEEWYGREIKNLLSLGEGSLSAGGDKEEGSSEQVMGKGGGMGFTPVLCSAFPRGLCCEIVPRAREKEKRPAMSHRVFQVLQAGIGSSRAVPGELLSCPTPAASGTGGLGSQQESPSPKGLCPETGNTAGESEEGAAGHRPLAASEEDSEQLSSASGARAAPLRPGHVPDSLFFIIITGAESGLSRQGSSAELLVPAEEKEEEAGLSIPSKQQEQGRDALEPLDSSEPHRYHLPVPWVSWAENHSTGQPLDSSEPHRTELSELCHALQLLQDLVERTSPQHRALYQGQPSGLPRLAQGDLEVMEAMVLQQLQQAVSPRIGNLSEEHSRDRDAQRTLLGDHGLFLRQHRVQLPEGVAEMFEQLLASGEEGQDSQVLREALPEEPGTVQSDESSLVLPSILTNGGEGKQRERREPGEERPSPVATVKWISEFCVHIYKASPI
ncbi:hypothetical protein Nmel_003500, partial [Mimus melanotis]